MRNSNLTNLFLCLAVGVFLVSSALVFTLPPVQAQPDNELFQEDMAEWVRQFVKEWLMGNETATMIYKGGGTPLDGSDFTFDGQHYKLSPTSDLWNEARNKTNLTYMIEALNKTNSSYREVTNQTFDDVVVEDLTVNEFATFDKNVSVGGTDISKAILSVFASPTTDPSALVIYDEDDSNNERFRMGVSSAGGGFFEVYNSATDSVTARIRAYQAAGTQAFFSLGHVAFGKSTANRQIDIYSSENRLMDLQSTDAESYIHFIDSGGEGFVGTVSDLLYLGAGSNGGSAYAGLFVDTNKNVTANNSFIASYYHGSGLHLTDVVDSLARIEALNKTNSSYLTTSYNLTYHLYNDTGMCLSVNTTSNLQELLNSTGIYETFNSTYDAYATNVSLNYTKIVFDTYNSTWDDGGSGGTDTNETQRVMNMTAYSCSGTDKAVGFYANGTINCSADESGGGGSKTLFVTSARGDEQYSSHCLDVACVLMTSTGSTQYTFRIPPDAITVKDISLIVIPDATETVVWDCDGLSYAVGESKTDHPQAVNNNQTSLTDDVISRINVTNCLDPLSADDFAGIYFKSDTSNIYAIGLEVQYDI